MRALQQCILPRVRLPVLLFDPSQAVHYWHRKLLSQPDLVQCTSVPPLAALELQSLVPPAENAGDQLGPLSPNVRGIVAMLQPVGHGWKPKNRRGAGGELTLRHSLPSTKAIDPFGRTNLVGGSEDRRISTAFPVSATPVRA